jgi:hypothetical protein
MKVLFLFFSLLKVESTTIYTPNKEISDSAASTQTGDGFIFTANLIRFGVNDPHLLFTPKTPGVNKPHKKNSSGPNVGVKRKSGFSYTRSIHIWNFDIQSQYVKNLFLTAFFRRMWLFLTFSRLLVFIFLQYADKKLYRICLIYTED